MAPPHNYEHLEINYWWIDMIFHQWTINSTFIYEQILGIGIILDHPLPMKLWTPNPFHRELDFSEVNYEPWNCLKLYKVWTPHPFQILLSYEMLIGIPSFYHGSTMVPHHPRSSGFNSWCRPCTRQGDYATFIGNDKNLPWFILGMIY